MSNHWSVCVIVLTLVPGMTHQFAITGHDVNTPQDTADLDVTHYDNDFAQTGDATRKRWWSGIIDADDSEGSELASSRHNKLGTLLDRMYKIDQTNDKPTANSNTNTNMKRKLGDTMFIDGASHGDTVEPRLRMWYDSRLDTNDVAIDKKDQDSDATYFTNPIKRYYRRRCNLSKLSRQAFVELIKTGKLCGRRIAALRFGLTGR